MNYSWWIIIVFFSSYYYYLLQYSTLMISCNKYYDKKRISVDTSHISFSYGIFKEWRWALIEILCHWLKPVWLNSQKRIIIVKNA